MEFGCTTRLCARDRAIQLKIDVDIQPKEVAPKDVDVAPTDVEPKDSDVAEQSEAKGGT